MIPCKPLAGKLTLFVLSLFVFSTFNNVSAQGAATGDVAAGKTLFLSRCASCHNIFKEGAYPSLENIEQRHKWSDHNELLKWINNPAGYMATDSYTHGLKS